MIERALLGNLYYSQAAVAQEPGGAQEAQLHFQSRKGLAEVTEHLPFTLFRE
jgi:hypothetical protein